VAVRPQDLKRERRSAPAPKAPLAVARKWPHSQAFPAISPGQHCPGHCPAPGAPFAGQPPAAGARPTPGLGAPLSISGVAELIGSSPWTVRQTLIPRGLPHFRFTARGRLIFYRDQVIRWIESQQGG